MELDIFFTRMNFMKLFLEDSSVNNSVCCFVVHTQNGNVSAPLVLWLQGGPGAPSMFGLFLINGPFYVTENLECKHVRRITIMFLLFRILLIIVMMREYHWNLEYNLLYIDNPVRTGYSFTDSDAGLATNQDEVAVNLYRYMDVHVIIIIVL